MAEPITDAELAELRLELARPGIDHPVSGAGVAPAIARDLIARITKLDAALRKISDIRDSIIGAQRFNWSEHAYPLVAALDEAGYEGAGYEIARKNLGTLIDQAKAADNERDQLRARLRELGDDLRRAGRGEHIIGSGGQLLKKYADLFETGGE